MFAVTLRDMSQEPQQRNKRIIVGISSLVCLTGAVVLIQYPDSAGLQGALVRVGTLLAACWLVLGRPPKWKRLSSTWMIVAGIVAAIVAPRAKAMFPLVAVIIGIALFARPRKMRD